MKNPFAPAKRVAKKLKVLLYGASGSGKTTAALTFPKAAVIDTEAGTDLYAGRDGTLPFDVLRAKTLTELEAAIAFIREGKHDYETLVIDSVTVLYEVAREALAAASKSGEMSFREWGKLNNRMEALYNRLTDLPVHVVMIARESTEYEGSGDSLRKVGTKPDTDKSIVYNADFVIRMDDRRQGRVIKSRGQDIAREGDILKCVNWDVFAPLAAEYGDGVAVHHPNKSDAITAEAEPMTDKSTVTAFVMKWREQGLTNSEILAALDVERVSLYPRGRVAADAAVQAWLDSRVVPKPAPAPVSATPAKQPSVDELLKKLEAAASALDHDTAGDEDPFHDDADLLHEDEGDDLHAYAGSPDYSDVPF